MAWGEISSPNGALALPGGGQKKGKEKARVFCSISVVSTTGIEPISFFFFFYKFFFFNSF